MSHWRVRRSYGHGAAHVALAPVFTKGPFSERETFAESVAVVVEELAGRGPLLARRAGATLGLALAVTFALVLATPRADERDEPVQDLVLIVPEPAPLEEPAPEPEPEAAAPEPLLAQAEPAPVPPPARVEPAPAPPPVRPMPPRTEPLARVEPVPRPQAEPAPAPPPRLRIDAIASAPETAPLPPERVERTPAPERRAPTFRIDPVAPSFPVAAAAKDVASTPPAAPLRTAARAPTRAAPPVAFALEPVAAAEAPLSPAANAAAPTPRTAPRSASTRTASAALPRFEASPPPARYADAAPSAAPPTPMRVVRTAAREEASAPAPTRSFQGVPLGSLAACVSDREEDSLKLSVMAAAGSRESCSSRAGNYRFVETKNLNAFLMWIERNPDRKAADRCIELRLALECLAGTPNRRTDNG